MRMRRLGESLSEELERTKEESRRSRHLGELAWTIEIEEVMRADARRRGGARRRRRRADHRPAAPGTSR